MLKASKNLKVEKGFLKAAELVMSSKIVES